MLRFAGMKPHYPCNANFNTFRTYFHQYCEGAELTRDDKRNFTKATKRLRNYVLSHADTVLATLSCTGKEFLRSAMRPVPQLSFTESRTPWKGFKRECSLSGK
ncbi:hypothetical protein VTN00DRAFT_7284 [Thermoascus crustaceus]|uniref:uncharacterized protein n=1 Tax=Thermoascus crustaceus TaxID=5088 RepID=UPI0037435898